jgi:hypothetical protein
LCLYPCTYFSAFTFPNGLLPLPPAVVGLFPEYQGYEYVVVNDEIVIVQPSTRWSPKSSGRAAWPKRPRDRRR